MALAGGNNQNDRGLYEPNYYARLTFKNPDDGLTVGSAYWKGSLKLTINERKNNDKPNELAYIHLSPMKASILAKCVADVIATDEDIIKGVPTGAGETQGLITVGRENGAPFLVLGQVDKNGNMTQSQRFNFIQDYHFGLTFSSLSTMEFEKTYENNEELLQFQHLLEDFSRSANGAIGASVWGVARYETAKLNNMVYKLAEKMGVETGGNSSNSGSANQSYFANGGQQKNLGSSNKGGFNGMNQPASSGSIDDLESDFEN